MTGAYKVSELVWGKMKGFPAWPGIIAEPTPDVKKPSKLGSTAHFIYFFGSNNYSWLDEKCLQPYADAKESCMKANKTVAFLDACKAIEAYIESGATGIPTVEEPTPTKKTKKELKRRASQSEEVEDIKPSSTPKKVKSLKESSEDLKETKKSKTSSDDSFSTPKDPPKKRKKSSINDSNSPRDRSLSQDHSSNSRLFSFHKNPRMSLIDRPSHCEPEIITTDVNDVPQCLLDKKITPSSKTIGFLGLGIMGSRVAKNILLSGHKLMVWNRTPDKCNQFVDAGAEVGLTPADVVQRSDITFSCVSDPTAARELVFGNCGVLGEMNEDKGFIELTSIDADTSTELSESITLKGGRYLEAQMLGSMKEADEGRLIFLCAGDKSLYDDCDSCFKSCSENHPYYLGSIGSAANMNLVFQIMNSIAIAGLAEGLSLAKELQLSVEDLAKFLKLSSVNCDLYNQKMSMMIREKFPTSLPLQHSQKDLKLALKLGEQLNQSLPLTATVNEIYKHARRIGLGSHDASSVYIRSIKY